MLYIHLKHAVLTWCAIFMFIFSFSLLSAQEIYVEEITESKISFQDGSDDVMPQPKAGSTATVFFLVRHSEKESGDNPGLTDAGKLRSQRLSSILAKSGISRIYSTDYKRTVATAEPLAQLLRIPIEYYTPGNLDRVAKSLASQYAGEKILVVGHSNTTPDLFNALVGSKVLDHIPDGDYTNLYVVVLFSDGEIEYLTLNF